MKKLPMYLIILACMALLFTGCIGNKIEVTTYDKVGNKVVTKHTAESSFNASQAQAWEKYYDALKSPPVIATLTTPNNDVITINSQVPPPAPVIRQHRNQYIGPIADLGKFVAGGLFLDRIVSGVVKGMGDTNISNTGDGTVSYDMSESIASDNVTSDNGSVIETGNDKSVTNINPDPRVVVVDPPEYNDPVIIEQPEYNDPIIIEQPPYNDPIIVEPVFAPPTSE